MTAAPALEARGLTVSFGGVHAVQNLSFRVETGSLTGLIGPNGAGKTTTIDALTGFVRHRGRVLVGDVDLSEAPPHRRARAGLVRTWQSLELFHDLTVRENCVVAAHRGSIPGELADLVRPSRAPDRPSVERALQLVGMADDADRLPHELPLGHQKLVGVARALAARPRVLLLDEPAAGLSGSESADLGQRLIEVVRSGISVLLVDHDMGLVLSVCDRVVVLDFGEVIAEGPPKEISSDDRVVAAYLGETSASVGPGAGVAPGRRVS